MQTETNQEERENPIEEKETRETSDWPRSKHSNKVAEIARFFGKSAAEGTCILGATKRDSTTPKKHPQVALSSAMLTESRGSPSSAQLGRAAEAGGRPASNAIDKLCEPPKRAAGGTGAGEEQNRGPEQNREKEPEEAHNPNKTPRSTTGSHRSEDVTRDARDIQNDIQKFTQSDYVDHLSENAKRAEKATRFFLITAVYTTLFALAIMLSSLAVGVAPKKASFLNDTTEGNTSTQEEWKAHNYCKFSPLEATTEIAFSNAMNTRIQKISFRTEDEEILFDTYPESAKVTHLFELDDAYLPNSTIFAEKIAHSNVDELIMRLSFKEESALIDFFAGLSCGAPACGPGAKNTRNLLRDSVTIKKKGEFKGSSFLAFSFVANMRNRARSNKMDIWAPLVLTVRAQAYHRDFAGLLRLAKKRCGCVPKILQVAENRSAFFFSFQMALEPNKLRLVNAFFENKEESLSMVQIGDDCVLPLIGKIIHNPKNDNAEKSGKDLHLQTVYWDLKISIHSEI